MAEDIIERAAVVALLRRSGGSWPQLASDVLDAGSALHLLRNPAGQQDLLAADTTTDLDAAIAEVAAWQADSIGVHCVLDPTYPALLRDIRDRPPLVFTRGRLSADQHAVAVVGSRNASPRGLAIARRVAHGLVERQVTVVSGLAAGIDTAAHEATLEAGGRTVAVIGTGVDRCYPAHNRPLQDRIADQGLVLSQFWPATGSLPEHFPMRNAVMSGYCAATIVIEAGEQSGVRIQTRLALQHGRHVILLADLLRLPWAQALAERPGVTVAGSPDELFAAVGQVLAQRDRQLIPTDDFAGLVFS